MNTWPNLRCFQEGPASMRQHWQTHSSGASLSQFSPRFTPRPHYHQALTIGRQSCAMSTLVIRCSWGLLGFRHWLQLMCCVYLLTMSEYFEWGRTFGIWMKSEASPHTGGNQGNEARKLGHQAQLLGWIVGQEGKGTRV